MMVLGFSVGALWQQHRASITSEDVGRLAVAVARQTPVSPMATWRAMEDHVGKPFDRFTPSDRLRAAEFLVRQIRVRDRSVGNDL
jgi:hypothetical protein